MRMFVEFTTHEEKNISNCLRSFDVIQRRTTDLNESEKNIFRCEIVSAFKLFIVKIKLKYRDE